jgi:hypothetical protein
MDKLKIKGQNLGRVFNSRYDRACVCYEMTIKAKLPNLKLRTQPNQLLGSLVRFSVLQMQANLLLLCFVVVDVGVLVLVVVVTVLFILRLQ